jgi:hypothetical protein
MRNGWSIDSLYLKAKNVLADSLGADAIISGSVWLINLKSAGVVGGAGLIGGTLTFLSFPYDGDTYNTSGLYTDSLKYVLNVHDGKSGELLWEGRGIYLSFTGGELENGEMHNVIKGVMWKARNKFPYKKK